MWKVTQNTDFNWLTYLLMTWYVPVFLWVSSLMFTLMLLAIFLNSYFFVAKKLITTLCWKSLWSSSYTVLWNVLWCKKRSLSVLLIFAVRLSKTRVLWDFVGHGACRANNSFRSRSFPKHTVWVSVLLRVTEVSTVDELLTGNVRHYTNSCYWQKGLHT